MTRSLMARVADATIYYPAYRYKAWGYGEWIAMEGLLAAAPTCEDPRYFGFVEGLIAGWISKRERLVPADHVAPGVACVELYRATGREIYLERALALATLLLQSPRSARGARLLRPDANQHVYVDCLYSDPPLFCSLAQVTGERRWFDEAAAYALEFWSVLVDARIPLLYHGYSDRTQDHIGLLWGRGVGWALLGLADTLGMRILSLISKAWPPPCATCRMKTDTGIRSSITPKPIWKTRLPVLFVPPCSKQCVPAFSIPLLRNAHAGVGMRLSP
jgi:rhamnogalacturonyl hydrolase YesR